MAVTPVIDTVTSSLPVNTAPGVKNVWILNGTGFDDSTRAEFAKPGYEFLVQCSEAKPGGTILQVKLYVRTLTTSPITGVDDITVTVTNIDAVGQPASSTVPVRAVFF